MEQKNSVHMMRVNRNMDIITTCPLARANILSCDLSLEQANRFMNDNGGYLEHFVIVINTCNSSLSAMFVFSNNATNRSDNLQCPTKIPLGQFNIMFDLDIFIDQTTNFTVIGTAVSRNS